MKQLNFILLCCIVLFFTGCAGKKTYMEGVALVDEYGDAAKHPTQMEKDNDTFISFHAIRHSNLDTEATPVYSEEFGFELKGFFPIIGASTEHEDAPIIGGFCYTEGPHPIGLYYFERMNCMINGTKKGFNSNGYKFFVSNKDTGVWIFPPAHESSSEDGEWDHEKFLDDFEYRVAILNKFGQSIDQINQSWNNILESQSGGQVHFMNDVQQFTADPNSVRWQKQRKNIIRTIGHEIVLPDGEVVVSNLSVEEMTAKLSQNPMVTPFQKFSSGFNNLIIGTPDMMMYSAVTGLLQGTIAASLDSEWKASVARAIIKRKDFAGHMNYHRLRQKKMYAQMMRI
jgi:hypothetical protein